MRNAGIWSWIARLDQRDVFLRVMRTQRVEDALGDFAPIIVGQSRPVGWFGHGCPTQYRCPNLEHSIRPRNSLLLAAHSPC